jgi:hypothetical protein
MILLDEPNKPVICLWLWQVLHERSPFDTRYNPYSGSMRTTLKQRHTMLDHHLEQLIQESPDLQVLEIACGLFVWFVPYRANQAPDR